MSITFSTCFYNFNSKFDTNTYLQWMNNFFSIVNNFYLVVYTNEDGLKHINTNNNPRIKVVVKQVEEFHNYRHKDFWIENHEQNFLLKDRIDWKVNMLWSEKIWFVKDTINKNDFNTDYFGWCDIGYFRNRPNDVHTNDLIHWSKHINLDKNKIHYACINNDNLNLFIKNIQDRNEHNLPKIPIPSNQNTIAGGFFILSKDNIDWWFMTYDNMLQNYFQHEYLVKDDQIILADCIFNHLSKFKLYKEKNQYDNWFMFQRILI